MSCYQALEYLNKGKDDDLEGECVYCRRWKTGKILVYSGKIERGVVKRVFYFCDEYCKKNFMIKQGWVLQYL